MDILAELTALKTDFTAAQALLAEAENLKASYDSKLSEKEAELNESIQTVALKDKGIADLNLAISGKDKEIADLKALVASLKQAEVTAESKAVDMVAAQGIAPVKVEIEKEASKPASREEILKQWGAITNSKDRAAFYKEHKAVINGK